MDHPRLPPRLKSPEELAREQEDRLVQEAIRARRWRIRRTRYAVATVLMGIAVPSASLLAAGSISGGNMAAWIERGGWLPLMVTVCGGAAGAGLVFVRGWGVALGMITFGALFMLLIAITSSVLGSLLPAMPGLVALFVMAGALVGYLTAMEDGD